MAWFPVKEASEILGISKSAVDSRGRRGTLDRVRKDGVWRYWVETEEERLQQEQVEVGETDGYEYVSDGENGEDGFYIFYLKCLGGKKKIFPAYVVRSMVLAYSKHGGNANMNEVGRQFGLSRQMFEEIKTKLGITKTSPPWPREDIARRGEDELTEDFVALKVDRVMRKGSRLSSRQIERAAHKWLSGPGAIIDALRTLEVHPVRLDPSPRPKADHVTVIGLSDLHIGKRPFGSDGDLDEQKNYLMHLVERAISTALKWGAPKRFYIHCGGDLLHVDNESYTTTKGTPQGGQSVGSAKRAWRTALELMRGVIEECSKYAPVLVPVIPGNHDWLLSYTIGGALEMYYRGTPDVRIDLSEDPRLCYGEWAVPILFDHGNLIKKDKYPAVLSVYAPKGTDIRKGVVFRGHFHGNSQEEIFGGVNVVTMPSAGPMDDWHRFNEYVHKPKLGLYRIEPHGLRETTWVG